MSNLIPSQTGLTLRRTDTLINLTNKLFAKTKIKGISEMSDDELWKWWLSLDDEQKWFLLSQVLLFILRKDRDERFDKNYNYRANFDWLDRNFALQYIKELQELTELNLFRKSIKDISVLSHFTQLAKLDLRCNQIQDVSVLSNLTQLETLYLDNNQIQDISALSNLTQLETLYLDNNQIQDISMLSNLTQLTELSLYDNQVQDISILANLTQLTRLYLNENQIQDIIPLANLRQLQLLYLRNSPIHPQDIDWLKQQLSNCEIYF